MIHITADCAVWWIAGWMINL